MAATATQAAMPANEPLTAQADSDTLSESGDSAYGASDTESSYTASITSSITAYQQENGRRYHAYQAGRYVLPNDEQEQDRLDLQYHAFRLAYGDQTHFAPIGEEPERILDVGTGTGIWAIDMSDKFPDAQIIGTDLSPIQPRWVPQNVKFEVDDAEQDWTFPEDHFDLIHDRIMVGCLLNWDRYYAQAFKHCKPGGWVESQEMDLQILTDDDSLPKDSYVKKWCENCEEGMQKMGNTLRITGHQLAEKMRKAGFINVTVQQFKIPIGTWPADPKMRETGTFQLVAMLDGLQGLTLALWTRALGWTAEEIEVFLAKCRDEWKNRKVHSYWPLYVTYGQKPAK